MLGYNHHHHRHLTTFFTVCNELDNSTGLKIEQMTFGQALLSKISTKFRKRMPGLDGRNENTSSFKKTSDSRAGDVE